MSLTILFFHSDLDAFSFSCPAALARIIVIMLNKNGQSREYVCLVPGLRGKKRWKLFLIDYDASCELVIYGLYYAEVIFIYTQFVESFYHEKMLNFVKVFFCIYWDDTVILLAVYVVYQIY